MLTLIWIVAVLVAALVLAYANASGLVFTAAIAIALARSARGPGAVRCTRPRCRPDGRHHAWPIKET